MKDLCKLIDGTIFEVEDTTLWSVDTYCENEEAAVALCAKLTPDNVSKIEFYSSNEDGTPNEVIASYEDTTMLSIPTRATMDTGRVLVHVGFSVPEAIEQSVANNTMDITDIQMALAELYELVEGLMS